MKESTSSSKRGNLLYNKSLKKVFMVFKKKPEMKRILLMVLFVCLLSVQILAYAQSTLALQEKCLKGTIEY